jgi:hypothetical protein
MRFENHITHGIRNALSPKEERKKRPASRRVIDMECNYYINFVFLG